MKVRVEDVSFAYPEGALALTAVSVAIESGQAVAIVGENGAGKTTLAKHINGLLRASRGRVWVGDWIVADHSVAQMAARVGYMFQNPDEQLFANRVWDEVAFGPRNLGVQPAEVERAVDAALSIVGLEAEPARNPYDLQPMARRMLTLASVLAMNTPILILDEPTTGLDAGGQVRIGAIVEDLRRRRKTIIAVSHDIDFCAEHFERVLVMSSGQVLADGPTEQVLSQPAMLAQASVEPPQIVQLSQGIGLRAAPRSVDAFLSAYGESRLKPD